MATATAPDDDAAPAARGTKGEASRRRSGEHRGAAGGGGGGGGGGEGSVGQKRKRKEVFIYGNYRNYYGYRIVSVWEVVCWDGSLNNGQGVAGKASGRDGIDGKLHVATASAGPRGRAAGATAGGPSRKGAQAQIDRNVGEDPRLEAFKKQWFEGKDCLDIGCNQGLVTIGLAMKFDCRSILGVDIDSGLIETAKWNLRRISRLNKESMNNDNAQESSVSPSQSSLEEGASNMSNGNHSNHKNSDLFKIVSFRRENFVESMTGCSEEKYDTIICLSVTKWIHLNWGDDGLITLFVKIWRLLRPGGIFIMEPQPWRSYKNNRLVSEVAKENFNNICIYPEKFREILLDKVGFRSVEMITDRLVGTVTGFDRPIEVYHK
ncbi:hypothetical protein ACP4OV_005647 [Aristida adscensionis]